MSARDRTLVLVRELEAQTRSYFIARERGSIHADAIAWHAIRKARHLRSFCLTQLSGLQR